MIPRTSRTARPTTQRHIAWDLESTPHRYGNPKSCTGLPTAQEVFCMDIVF